MNCKIKIVKTAQAFALLGALLAVNLFLGSPQAEAQAKGYVGGLFGLSVPDHDETSSRMAFGILGGARLDGEFGLGAYYISSSKEETIGAADLDFNYQLYGFEGSFHFEGVADGAFVGLRVGISKVKVGTEEYSPTHYGALFGYDYSLTDAWTVGLEGSFMRIEGDKKAAGDLEGFGALQFLASTKMWF